MITIGTNFHNLNELHALLTIGTNWLWSEQIVSYRKLEPKRFNKYEASYYFLQAIDKNKGITCKNYLLRYIYEFLTPVKTF